MAGGFIRQMPPICRALGELLLWLTGRINGDKRVLVPRAKLQPVTSDLWIPIRRTKHRLITKLSKQMEANLRDESIKSN
jgi:hypothetical protein